MNYKVVVAIALLAVNYTHTAEREKDALERGLVSNHTRVFSKDNLILSRLPADDLRFWDKAIDNVKKFVAKNASKLTSSADELSSISNDLISLLVVIYNQYIAPALKNPEDRKEGLSSINPEKIDLSKINTYDLEEAFDPLQQAQSRLLSLQKVLEKQKKAWRESMFTPKIKGDAAELLLTLELTLETTVVKAINDIKKIVAAAQK